MAHIRRALVTVAAAAMAMLAACPAWADLPAARPPEEPPKRDPIPLRNHQDQAEARREAIRQAQEARRDPDGNDAAEAPAGPAVDLDVLMKVVSDPKSPIRLRWPEQLAQVNDFRRLTVEQQNRAVPELLDLLDSRTPLPYGLVLPDVRPLEIRHRANTALTRIAGVYFGQFPGGGPVGDDTPERRAEDKKASADLVARWTAWWRDVKDLDGAGRKAAADRLRRELLANDDTEVANNNLTLISAQPDLADIDVLAELAGRLGPERTPFADRVVQVFACLCAKPEAPVPARFALLDLITAINTPTVESRRPGGLSVCANIMLAITGVRASYEMVTVVKDEETRKETRVRLVTKATIDAWREALAKQAKEAKAEKAKAEKAGEADPPGPAADPNRNAGDG